MTNENNFRILKKVFQILQNINYSVKKLFK